MVRAAVILIVLLVVGFAPWFIWGSTPGTLQFLLVILIIGAIYAGGRYYMWYKTIYILTTQRIIGVNQDKVFLRNTAEVPLRNIQNINHVKKGPFSTIFNFGSIKIQTTGAVLAIEIKCVEEPLEFQQKILDQVEKLTGRRAEDLGKFDLR